MFGSRQQCQRRRINPTNQPTSQLDHVCGSRHAPAKPRVPVDKTQGAVRYQKGKVLGNPTTATMHVPLRRCVVSVCVPHKHRGIMARACMQAGVVNATLAVQHRHSRKVVLQVRPLVKGDSAMHQLRTALACCCCRCCSCRGKCPPAAGQHTLRDAAAAPARAPDPDLSCQLSSQCVTHSSPAQAALLHTPALGSVGQADP